MSEIILSICIATYNRGAYIKETIDSILSQNIPDKVEIVILNSGSTDNTEEIIKAYNSSLIKYYFHEEKCGVDIDYNSVINYASGKYCWLFTDDDLLKKNSINYILNIISNKSLQLDYIVVNSELSNIDMSYVYKKYIVNIDHDIVFDNSVESQNLQFSLLGDYLSFIGCLVVNREFWYKRNKSNYYGTEFIHVGVLFQDYFCNQVYFVSEPLLSIRLGNSNWTDRSFKIWIINWPNLILSFDKYTLKAKKAVLKLNNFSVLWKISYYRAIGAFDYKLYKKVASDLTYPVFLKFLIKIISISPKFIFKTIISLYSRILSRKWVLDELSK
jgi:glycosyltransferase involved in cell wall biosynthesis